MKKISIYYFTAFLFVSFLAGLGAGYSLTPQYRLSMYDRDQMELGQADRWLDLRYINAMIAHHRGAMLLAEQAKEYSERAEILGLAEEILKNEPALIKELYSWKKEWYKDSRSVRDPLSVKLGGADDKFDLRFLNALIAHHQAGILMTNEIRQKSSRSEILNNADAVESFLENSSVVLKGWRMNWYNT